MAKDNYDFLLRTFGTSEEELEKMNYEELIDYAKKKNKEEVWSVVVKRLDVDKTKAWSIINHFIKMEDADYCTSDCHTIASKLVEVYITREDVSFKEAFDLWNGKGFFGMGYEFAEIMQSRKDFQKTLISGSPEEIIDLATRTNEVHFWGKVLSIERVKEYLNSIPPEEAEERIKNSAWQEGGRSKNTKYDQTYWLGEFLLRREDVAEYRRRLQFSFI